MVTKAYVPGSKITNDYDIKKYICGCKQLGLQIENIKSVEEIPADERDYVVIGDINTINLWKQRTKIGDHFVGDYPNQLGHLYGRSIELSTLHAVLEGDNGTIFLKPYDKGLFKPFVTHSLIDDYLNIAHVHEDACVWIQQPMHFTAEWRVFILKNKVQDVRQYRGSWKEQPDLLLIDEIEGINIGHSSYCVDIGKTESGSFVIEVNRANCFGSYGLNLMTYAEMLCDWWNEIWQMRIA